MITRTHNAYHIGDNLVHLHFLRKVALANPDRQFVHYADWILLDHKSCWRVTEIVADIPNIKLEPIGYTNPHSINAWRGDNQFWYDSKIRNDFVRFHTEEWFPYLADKMDVENPIKCAEDMLFDYPAIAASRLLAHPPFDVLLINSAPCSGQFALFSEWQLGILAGDLAEKGLSVISTAPTPCTKVQCTQDTRLSITDIGHLSLHCHTVVMVSTGPSWTTFNVWNQDSIKLRIILLDSERIDLAPNTMHCVRIEEATEVLRKAGLL